MGNKDREIIKQLKRELFDVRADCELWRIGALEFDERCTELMRELAEATRERDEAIERETDWHNVADDRSAEINRLRGVMEKANE